jgi:hypothetical protein
MEYVKDWFVWSFFWSGADSKAAATMSGVVPRTFVCIFAILPSLPCMTSMELSLLRARLKVL